MTARLILALLTLTSLVACKDEEREDALDAFRSALPDEATLAVVVPDEVALTEAGLEIREAALGQRSELRDASALARNFLDGSVRELLGAYRELTQQRPVLRSEDRVVWWTPSADREAEHLLVMERADDGHFTFTTWIRPRRVVRERWKFLAFGSVTPGATSGDGRGALWVDFDNDRRQLETHGKVVVLWSEDGPRRDLDVRAFGAATVAGEARRTRGYRYHEDASGGVLAFDAGLLDVHPRAGDRDGLEHVRVITRWDAQKRFRSDATATSPEVTNDGFRALVISQCWHAPAGRVLFERVVGIGLRDGADSPPLAAGDAAACPFERAATPILPPADAEPTTPPEPPETDPDRDWGD